MDAKLNGNNLAGKNHKVTTHFRIALYLWESIAKRLNEKALCSIHVLALFDPMGAGTRVASWLITGLIFTKLEIKMIH